jgi:hypothetical protein
MVYVKDRFGWRKGGDGIPSEVEFDAAYDAIIRHVQEKTMHYRNGRVAANGDKVMQLSSYGGEITAIGVLHSATPANDYCNGAIAPIQNVREGACLCDCLHLDDVAALLAEKGLDKRPSGK